MASPGGRPESHSWGLKGVWKSKLPDSSQTTRPSPLLASWLISLTLAPRPQCRCEKPSKNTNAKIYKCRKVICQYVEYCVEASSSNLFKLTSAALAWGSDKAGQGDPGADGALQRDQQETDLRIAAAAAAAASFTPLTTAAGCFTPLNYLNTPLVSPALRSTNLFVMHGIAVRKREGTIGSRRSPERRRLRLLPPSQELAAPFNPRRFSNDLPAAATGEGKRRKMDEITADIKAALKCTRGRKMVSAPWTFFSPVLFPLGADGNETGRHLRYGNVANKVSYFKGETRNWNGLVSKPAVHLITFFKQFQSRR